MQMAIFILRIVSLTLLVFLALKLLVSRERNQGATLMALFILGVIAHLLSPVLVDDRQYHIFTYLVFTFSTTAPVFLWLLTRSIFDDIFSLRWSHLIYLVLMGLVGLYTYLYRISRILEWHNTQPLPGLLAELIKLLPQLPSLVFGILALSVLFRSASGDLVDWRIRLRKYFILISTIILLSTVIVELGLKDSSAPGLELLKLAVIAIACAVFGLTIDRAEPFRQKQKTEKAAPKVDSELLGQIKKSITEEQLFRDDKLTIRSLATTLKVHEYQLRRAINQGLGYRNFNQFLNHYRIEYAEQKLMTSDDAVIRIAYEAGYASLAPFNRAFKEKYGIGPQAYRQKKT